MRGAPQVGFSATIRRISPRTSVDSFFLPTRFLAFEIKLQYSSKPSTMPANHSFRSHHEEGLQVGFSATIRRISPRTSVDSFFLPSCFLTLEIKLQ